jgi:hypothetical protein
VEALRGAWPDAPDGPPRRSPKTCAAVAVATHGKRSPNGLIDEITAGKWPHGAGAGDATPTSSDGSSHARRDPRFRT